MVVKLLFTVGILIGAGATAISTEPPNPQGRIALEAINPHYIEYKVVHKELIDCLIRYESEGDQDAKGDLENGVYMANGVLQFWKTTFNQYKERYYLFWLRYDQAKDQIRLADTMLKEDIGNLRHWTTAWRCGAYM